jgi:hypothetical protein
VAERPEDGTRMSGTHCETARCRNDSNESFDHETGSFQHCE